MTERSDLAADLSSGEPTRVRAALADLDRRWRERREVPMVLPEPGVLDAFPGRAPTEAVMDYLSVLGGYRAFAPTVSAHRLVEIWVETQLRHGDGATGLQIALRSRHSQVPQLRPASVIETLARTTPQSDDEVAASAALVRHLLDSDLSHDETVEALRHNSDADQLGRVIAGVAGWLDDDERAGFGV